jgi:GNAT superfamily N-acetyltransferase
MKIRPAHAADLAALQAIERDAGTLFAEIGMDAVAGDEPLPLDVLEQYQRDGRAWIAVDTDDEPVGYIIAEVLDGNAHIEQVSVRPASSRRGVGRALVDRVVEWAHELGLGAVTLTTFAEVPWNGPYYKRLGFRPLEETEVTRGLREKRAEEAAHGLDEWPRICMRREL